MALILKTEAVNLLEREYCRAYEDMLDALCSPCLRTHELAELHDIVSVRYKMLESIRGKVVSVRKKKTQ